MRWCNILTIVQARLPVLPTKARRAARTGACCAQGNWATPTLNVCIRLTMPQRLNEIPATIREPAGPEDTPETLEEERKQAQEVIDNGTYALCYPSISCVY